MRIKFKRFRFKLLSYDYTRNCIRLRVPVGFIDLAFRIPSLLIEKKIYTTKQFSPMLVHILKNNIRGFIFGFFAQIVPEGVGFRFVRYSSNPYILGLSLGHSHPIYYDFSRDIKFRCLKYRLLLYGANKASLNFHALAIRNFRPPDAYKGKGLKFAKEILKFKPGKLRQR